MEPHVLPVRVRGGGGDAGDDQRGDPPGSVVTDGVTAPVGVNGLTLKMSVRVSELIGYLKLNGFRNWNKLRLIVNLMMNSIRDARS